MIYLLTPTGGRPECLELLAGYIDAQDYSGAMTWIVVDDVKPASPVPSVRSGITVDVVTPHYSWKPGQNTQAQSILVGLSTIQEEVAKVLVFEDDDVYLPGHVSNMVKHLGACDLVGEKKAKYYNVRSGRYREFNGGRHCALASTALKGAAIDCLRRVCVPGKTFIDSRLWREYQGPKKRLNTSNVVGVKGMPGRPGIGVGHRTTFGRADIGKQFAKSVGPDIAKHYERFG